MGKSIKTLITDIYNTVGKKDWLDERVAAELSTGIAGRLLENGRKPEVPRLRLSQMGPVCEKQLWHSIHTPSLREPFPPYVRIKFVYGELIESLIISMAKAAGHEVTGEQDAVVVDGISGHRDCVIDGYVVDVKSAATRSFKNIQGKQMVDDPFLSSYLDQLDGYLVGSASDDLVRHKDVGFILAVDKTLGHLTLYEHHVRKQHIEKRIKHYKEIVSKDTPPSCTCGTVPYGASGNIALDTKASYSDFKRVCFPHLRTFLYSGKVVHLTKVVREPNVTEIRDYGREVGEMDTSGYTF